MKIISDTIIWIWKLFMSRFSYRFCHGFCPKNSRQNLLYIIIVATGFHPWLQIYNPFRVSGYNYLKIFFVNIKNTIFTPLFIACFAMVFIPKTHIKIYFIISYTKISVI